MIPPLPAPRRDLWVCHACKMLGTEAEAKAHRVCRGHDVERLDDETAQAVREERDRQSAEFIASLMVHGPRIAPKSDQRATPDQPGREGR